MEHRDIYEYIFGLHISLVYKYTKDEEIGASRCGHEKKMPVNRGTVNSNLGMRPPDERGLSHPAPSWEDNVGWYIPHIVVV